MAAVITQTSSLANNASIKLNITAPLPSPTQPAKKTNILSSLPPSLVPYAELMRLHQPAGIYAAYVPHLIGVFLAAASPTLTSHRPTPTHLASLTILHALSNTLLRGSACAYNDALDAPYDRQVARCKNRPVARGAVSVAQAHAFAFFLGLCWILTLSTLPSTSYMPAALLAGSMAFYPFCKRVTHFPQLVLGLSLALSQGIGYGSLGVDLRVLDSRTQIALVCLYVSYVVHTMIYDTVYAHQDLEDDLKAGVLSMAVLCQGRTKIVLTGLAAAEVGLLGVAGWMMGFGGMYWGGAVGGSAVVLGRMICVVRLEEPRDCRRWFERLLWCTGACVIGGLVGEFCLRG
ncbi:UbiA prenyltransferase family-domain-containing protein [Aspergillus pseudonomiae]|uniref:UbiA prenyltransferase family-domain-containing protein n=1 Tax=Aspergillus pseudonomiae TaxID=1506151 RepID=A0A5N7DVH8_9EURO|nr:UbiA prenyltransferase family-domain-containing protein [Aspergillus pseudonomiae]KAB8261314.1 UbiA prenyltransferase family-domain-containing protein [Aspergillus pseudonomiae]KAE8410049.1 UbiA prenyltransferase family-domain-containing protein [Aspergillus pseudonomiae]